MKKKKNLNLTLK